MNEPIELLGLITWGLLCYVGGLLSGIVLALKIWQDAKEDKKLATRVEDVISKTNKEKNHEEAIHSCGAVGSNSSCETCRCTGTRPDC